MASNTTNGTSSKASSLLASLTEDGGGGFPLAVDNGTGATTTTTTDEPDQDLFGEIPIDSPEPATTTKKSILASSGLLNNETPSSGLFDEVDELQRRQEQEELQRQQQEAAERARQEEQQRLEEQKRREEEEQKRLEEQQRMQQQQSYAQQQQVQQQQSYVQQQQQQQQQAASYPSLQQQPGIPPQQQQRQFMSSSANPLLSPTQGGFYRNHQTAPLSTAPTPNSYVYTTSGGTVQNHTIAPAAQGRYAAAPAPAMPHPSVTAGLHNASVAAANNTLQPLAVTAPPSIEPVFGRIKVSDPMLVSTGGVFASPPHWTYQVQTELKQDLGGFWIVRRRFRHVVALEDRLRQDCPGAILPPRPDKHATRAIEEASSTQSAEFAQHRAVELEVYLNALAQHPICGKSNVLRLFLALQDDVGTAWPEVSSNAITRLTNVIGGNALKISDATADAATHLPWTSSGGGDVCEDSAELLALQTTESVRMGAVTQAVPKLQGAVTLLREEGERSGAVGIEMGKLAKDVEGSDRDLSVPLELLANGILRHGRRTKRLALELGAALEPYALQYKSCRYEKAAFGDRRAALAKKQKERSKADATAQRLVVMQRGGGGGSGDMQLDRIETEASVSDKLAVDAVHECDEIGRVLKEEVNRVSFERRMEFAKSIKIIASAMKEAAAERAAVWEATRDSFHQAFPDYAQAGVAAAAVSSSSGSNHSAGV